MSLFDIKVLGDKHGNLVSVTTVWARHVQTHNNIMQVCIVARFI